MKLWRKPEKEPEPTPRTPTDMDANRLTITRKLPLDDAPEWLRRRGYRSAIAAGTFAAGLVFSRGDEPARLAVVGETLVFNGECVRVEASA